MVSFTPKDKTMQNVENPKKIVRLKFYKQICFYTKPIQKSLWLEVVSGIREMGVWKTCFKKLFSEAPKMCNSFFHFFQVMQSLKKKISCHVKKHFESKLGEIDYR